MKITYIEIKKMIRNQGYSQDGGWRPKVIRCRGADPEEDEEEAVLAPKES